MNDFPYVEFRNGRLWKVIEKSLDDLKENQDIDITTEQDYVVGYLCKKIHDEFGEASFCNISFNRYDCCTENDIIEVASQGITLKTYGFIDFKECAANFYQIEGGSGNCVGGRDITDLSFTFYTSPRPIKIIFLKRHSFLVLSNKKARKRFMSFQKQIVDLGYTTWDLS